MENLVHLEIIERKNYCIEILLKKIMLPNPHTKSSFWIRLQRKISFVTSFTIKKYYYEYVTILLSD